MWRWLRTRRMASDAPFDYQTVAGALSDVGCCRDSNEDRVQVILPRSGEPRAERGVLVVLADGMGGHAAGEVASRLAVERVSQVYYRSHTDETTALKQAFAEANRAIFALAKADAQRKGMGTTCTALVLRNGYAFLAHIGDSRLYLVRGDSIYQMSEDDSAVMEMLRDGLIDEAQAREHPERGVITRALGTKPSVEVETWEKPFAVRYEDTFLLCSDGLHDLVGDEEIRQAVVASSPMLACESLIALARGRGGYDNITAAVLNIQSRTSIGAAGLRDTREAEATA